MTIKDYYETNKSGIKINGKIVAPRISQNGVALQWVVDLADANEVFKHMADAQIINVRTMVKGDKMAIEAK